MKANKKIALVMLGVFISMNAYARVDFSDLTPEDKPNYFLACPKNYCKKAKPERTIHVYDMSAEKLGLLWLSVIKDQPRISKVLEDPEHGYYEYVQRTAILYLPNEITLQLIPVSQDSSTFAFYSKSVYGYYDFNSNSNRAFEWLQLLDAKIAKMNEDKALDAANAAPGTDATATPPQ